MKKLHSWGFCLIAAVMFLVFTGCSSDPDPGMEESNLIETLKKNKWVYSYVEDWTDTSYGGYYGTGNITLYFLDNNVGYGFQVHRDYDSDLGNSTNEYFWDFTYSVSGNKVICGNTTYTYSGGYLIDGNDYYEPSEMTQSDRERIANEDISSNMDDYVKVTGELIEDSLIYRIIVDQEKFSERYPQKKLEYTLDLEFGDYRDSFYEYYDYTLEMGGKSIVTFAVPLASVSYEMYFSTYKNIRAKIDRGEDLSESEKELFESILDYLQECLSDIEIRVYVKHNGETYDLYEDSFAVGVELDSSY